MNKLLFVLLFNGFIGKYSWGQQISFNKDVKGVVWDSLNKIPISNAYIQVEIGETLLKTTSDTSGSFSIKDLHSNIYLLKIEHLSYMTVETKIVGTKLWLVDTFYLSPKFRTIDSVFVSANRNDIEFLPEKYDFKNTDIAKDLLRKINGFVVWPDGTMTFKGKKIQKFTVNNKSFFTNNKDVALNNIPVSSIQKIRVVKINAIDSSVSLDIQLKDYDGFRHFGKASVGIGTKASKQIESIISFFDAKTQMSFYAGHNNINRDQSDFYTIISGSTFDNFQSNFQNEQSYNLAGRQKTYYVGASVNKDSIVGHKNLSLSSMRASYNFNNKRFQTNSNTSTNYVDAFNPDKYSTSIISSNSDISQKHDLNINYSTLKNGANYTFVGTSYIEKINNESRGQIKNSWAEEKQILEEINILNGIKFFTSNSLSIQNLRKIPGSIAFNSIYSSTFNISLRQTLMDNSDTEREKYNVNNNYRRNIHHNSNAINFTTNDIKIYKNLVYGNARVSYRSKTDITKNIGQKYDSTNSQYMNNKDISLNAEAFDRNIESVIKLTFKKTYNTQSLFSSFEVRNTENKSTYLSDKGSLNYRNRFNVFLPNASIIYNIMNPGKRSQNLSLNYTTYERFPTSNEISPFYDSSQLTTVVIPNLKLEYSLTQTLSLILSRSKWKTYRNTSLGIRLNKTSNYITTNTSYLPLGARKITYINYGEFANLNIFSKYKKNYVLKGLGQLQNDLELQFNKSHVPSLTNSQRLLIKTSNIEMNSSLNFLNTANTFMAFVRFNINKRFYSTENMMNRSNVSKSVVMRITQKIKRFKLNSEYSIKAYRFEGINSEVFNLWNFHLSYRNPKTKKIEVAFSAFDILRQNRNIIIENTDLYQSVTSSNSLAHFFQVSFSYFFQKF